MVYETFSDLAPPNQPDLTQSLVKTVQHNPRHPTTANVNYPDEYAAFVNPTNDAMTAVLVEDEVHPLSDIDTGNNNRLFLHHQPVQGATVLVDDGVIDDNLTDWENGIVYFSTLPVGEVTVQYMSNPDKYYGEYLQAIQDVLHALQWQMGAGQTLNEGIRNSEIFLDSLPSEIQARLPHAVCLRSIDRDIEIRSSTDIGAPSGTKHTITLGNGEDDVVVDGERVLIRGSEGTRIGTTTGDVLQVAGTSYLTGETYIGTIHESANPGISSPAVQAFENTGAPYVNETLRLAVHGDAVVYGDLYVFGSQIVFDIQENIQVNVYEENLEVGGNAFIRGTTRLGESTDSDTLVGGNLRVTGGLVVLGVGAEPASFDTPILFTNGSEKGDFQQTTIDGMDPSYWECVKRYLHSRNKHDTVFEGMRDPLFEGTMSYMTGAALLADTGAPTSLVDAFPTGLYYTGKFDDGDFFAVIKTGSRAGDRVPVKGYDGTSKQWTLARELDEALDTGDAFAIVHEKNSHADFLEAGVGLSAWVRASEVWPVVGWKKGIIKKRESDYEITSLAANSTLYVFMTTEHSLPDGMDEDEPTFYVSTSDVEDDWSILVGVIVTGPSTVTSATCYDLNAAFDSLWVKIDTAGSGNTQQAGSDWTVNARLGNVLRRMRYNGELRILLATDSSNAPDKTTIRELRPESAGYYVKTLGASSITVKTPSGTFAGLSLPYWVRVILP